MTISIVLVAIIFLFVGFITALLLQALKKHDGRLVIDGDDYFVAITTHPEELKKKSKIILKVISK